MSTLVNARTKQKRGTEGSIPALLEGELYECSDSNREYKGTIGGNVLISDINQQNINTANIAKLANRNFAINGNFDFWQRGVSAVNPVANTFVADRFKVACSLTGTPPTTLTHSKQTVVGDELLNSNYYYRLTSDSVGVLNASDYYFLLQSIENGVRKMCGNGKKITISFWAKSSIANKKFGVYCSQNYGSGGSPSAGDTINGSVFTLSNTWQKFSITLNTVSLNGKVFGTNNDDCLKVYFAFAYGLNNASALNASIGETFGIGTIDIGQIKIESGDMVTPFVPMQIGEELALCQRYYQNLKSDLFYAPCSQTNAVNANLLFPVPMRTIPTATFYSFNNNLGVASDSLNSATEVAITSASVLNNMICQLVNASSLFVVGKVYNYRVNLDAEIL